MKQLGIALAALLGAAVISVSLSGCFGKDDGADTAATTTDAALATTTTAAAPATTVPAFPFTGYVNADSLHVRPSAGTEGYAIGGLAFGDAVTVTGREGDWYKISFKGGDGYVSAQYIQDTMPVATTATDPTAADTTADAATDTTTAAE